MSGHVLDRPVWAMLNGRQADLAVVRGAAVRIDPRFGPFAAARDRGDEAQAALAEAIAAHGGEVWLVEPEEWPAPAGCRVVRTAPLLQMVADRPMPLLDGDEAITLGEGDAAEMAALAHATQPGPWGTLTHRYGAFQGLRHEGRLIAMAGERMRPAARYGEVSGVCTDPEWRGQGLAARLIRRVMAGIVARGEVPFLHSYAGNAKAIGLYESLGFRPRRRMIVTVLARAGETE